MTIAFIAVLLVLSAAEALILWHMPETVTPKPGALASLQPHVSIPAKAQRALMQVTPITIASWALGGFYFSARFMVNAIPNTSIRLFVGLSAGAAVCKTAFASTPANTVGLWCDSTDAGNLTILTADATPTPHTTTLQTAQTLTAGTLYEFVMIANPSPSGTPGTIVTNLINVGTDALLTSQNVSVNAPASTAFMAPQIGLSNRGNTAGGDCSLDVISVYLRPNLRLTPLGTP